MNNEEYKKKYQQQLQLGRRIWLEEYQKPRKGDMSDIEQTIQALMMSLEEKERELKEKEREVQEKENEKVRELKLFHWQMEQKEREEAEKDQEIQRYRHELREKDREEKEREERYHNQLQEKDKELQEKDREYQVVLQEKDRELQEKDSELQEKDRELQEKDMELQVKDAKLQVKDMELQVKDRELQEKDRELQEKDRKLKEKDEELCAVRTFQQQAELTDDHWVIDKDEVTLTKEELGRGSYAVVTVGIFRGLRVAVKSLHTIIISPHNLALFSREMSIASQVRHPNLVQFIGATKVGNPLILTELMGTSLNQELQRNQLTNQQILSIAQDVALGLNYLHLFKPQPIIHRDVSSPNVLLKPCSGPAGYEAKVADYGTAKVVQEGGSGTVMPGNAAYAAPEARDPDQHSPAMDVYSYSVLLMEMTLGSQPEMRTLGRRQQAGNVLWSDMKSLIQKGFNPTPRDRPTMAQAIESLKRMKV